MITMITPRMISRVLKSKHSYTADLIVGLFTECNMAPDVADLANLIKFQLF